MKPKPQYKALDAIFNNRIQAAASSMKPAYSPPAILDRILGDDGEVVLVLDNGRTTSQDAYDRTWKPIPQKEVIRHQHYKGENPGKNWNR